jgi:hypothetical protein
MMLPSQKETPKMTDSKPVYCSIPLTRKDAELLLEATQMAHTKRVDHLNTCVNDESEIDESGNVIPTSASEHNDLEDAKAEADRAAALCNRARTILTLMSEHE